MERKIPPPVLFLGYGAMIYLFPVFPNWADWNQCYHLLAVLLVAFGVAFSCSALFAFRQKRTTLSPTALEKTTTLVTHGIYCFSRNPMYLALAFWLAAWALWQHKLCGLFAVWCFIEHLNRFQILPEERMLAEKFGEAYLAYQRNVPRWLW